MKIQTPPPKPLGYGLKSCIAALLIGALCFSFSTVQGAFFEAEGSFGLLGVSQWQPHAGATEGPLQGVEQMLNLGLEIKPGDLTSLFLDVRFWPLGQRYYYGGDDEETNYAADGIFYNDFRPRISELYIESSTPYCLISLGRRAKHLGLGIFLNSGSRPWDSHKSIFEGLSCDVGPGLWRTVGIQIGVDKLGEGALLEKGDDVQQFHASIAYDDRHMLRGSDLRKQVSLYFAYRNSSSPHVRGRFNDKYLDLFGGLYWKYIALEAEGLIRMGTASGTAWDNIGARPGRRTTVDSIAAHSELSFTFPSPYPWETHNKNAEREYWQYQLAAEEEEDLAEESEPQDPQKQDPEKVEVAPTAEEPPTTSEPEVPEEKEELQETEESEEAQEEEGVSTESQEQEPKKEEHSPSSDESPKEEKSTPTPPEATKKFTPPASTEAKGAYFHKITLGYTYAPGDRDGYFKGSNTYLSESKRSAKTTALPLHPNFKPALILFNMRTPHLDIDGVYSGTQVVNAHVFAGGYSFLHELYGNVHLKVLGAQMDKGIPAPVRSYFKFRIDDQFPDDYYDFARDQYYPVGYLGKYLGTEIDIAYDLKISRDLLWGLAGGYLIVGSALDIGNKKTNVFALETYLIWDF